MNSNSAPGPGGAPKGKALGVALWVAQILLAVFFLLAGYNHGLRPIADVAKTASWVAVLPTALVRFIGFAELAGGVGLILPALTRVAPWLTPLAAFGLMIIMVLAIPFHVMRGESSIIGMHIIVASLAAFVMWGRIGRGRIAPRGR